MRKSNWIVFVVVAIASLILLGLWYAHGFDHVDAPLDLVLTFIWFGVMLVAGVVIHKLENRRRWRMQRLYLSPTGLFNSELGWIAYDGTPLLQFMRGKIAELDYGFKHEDVPDEMEPARFQVVVETERISDDEWQGSCRHRGEDEGCKFENEDELADVLADMMPNVKPMLAGTGQEQWETTQRGRRGLW